MDNIFFVLCEENERVSFAAIFYGGDSRAATRAIGRAESTRELRANPLGEHRAASVLCARISCARSSASRTQGPPRTPGALCVAAAVIQTLRRRPAHKNTSCSILVIKSLLD